MISRVWFCLSVYATLMSDKKHKAFQENFKVKLGNTGLTSYTVVICSDEN